MRFDHHTVVLLIRPPDAPTLPEPAAARLRDAHLAHQAGLVDRGHVLAAGPLTGQDDERIRGFCVLNVDVEMARELYHNDPAVRTGTLAVQVMSWMVPEGNVRFEDVPIPRPMLEAAAGDSQPQD